MRKILAYPTVAIATIAALACGGSSNDSHGGRTAQYEVVQEGSASGVTSTINGPSSQTPPVLTNTAADTTTSLATFQAGLPQNAPPGSIASTLPANAPGAPQYTVPAYGSAPVPARTAQPVRRGDSSNTSSSIGWSGSRSSSTTTAHPTTSTADAAHDGDTTATGTVSTTDEHSTTATTTEEAPATETSEQTSTSTSTSPQQQ